MTRPTHWLNGARPSPALQARVCALIAETSIGKVAKALRSSESFVGQVEMGASCKADALARLEKNLAELEGVKA